MRRLIMPSTSTGHFYAPYIPLIRECVPPRLQTKSYFLQESDWVSSPSLVGVQPMTAPSDQVFITRTQYTNSIGDNK